jgi:uncharacterized coiled-coil protein SlyX
MFRKSIIAAVGIFSLAVVVLGWAKTSSYIAGTRQVLNEEANDRAPMRLERARIEALIEKEQQNVLAFDDRVADMDGRRNATYRAVEDANKALAIERTLLKKIKALLDEKRNTYTIGRNSYSYAEVNADALDRLEAVRRMQEDIAFQESLVADLECGIKQGRGSVGDAQKRLAELKNAMARLEVRNANADVRLEIAKLTSAIAGAPLCAQSELEGAVRNYDRRIGQKERQAQSRLSVTGGPFRIDYAAAVVTQDASMEIEKVLGETQQDATVPPAPQRRSSAAEPSRTSRITVDPEQTAAHRSSALQGQRP